MEKTPHFTIILPTYHRPQYLHYAVKSVLIQDHKNFEILVLDDYGKKDQTEAVIKNFGDKRIIYKKNRHNLGYAQNLKNGFTRARGKYIFILSDDDVILQKDTLSTIYKEMEKTRAGYAQTGLLYYDLDLSKPSVIDHVATKLIYEKPAPNILLKTIDWHFGFMSGNVFRRDLVDIEKDILNDDIWWPYLRAAYKGITRRGGIYFGKHFIIARTSTTGLIAFLDMEKNKRFYMDNLFKIYREFDKSDKRYVFFLKNRLNIVIGTFIGIKYYTSNKNLVQMARAILKYRPDYIHELFFLKNFAIAFVCPRVILKILRYLRTIYGYRKLQNFTNQIKLREHLRFILK